jgi:hypothetical protein
MAQSRTISQATILATSNSIAVTVPSYMSLLSIETPAGFEGTTLTFKGTGDRNAAPLDIYDGSVLYSQPSGVSRFIPITKPLLFQGLEKLVVVSNVGESPSNVTADRILTLTFGSA